MFLAGASLVWEWHAFGYVSGVQFHNLFNKWFPLIVVGFLAVTAFFQALGISHLLSGWAALDTFVPKEEVRAASPPPPDEPRSICGAFGAGACAEPPPPNGRPSPGVTISCEGVAVTIVTELADSTWSTATVRTPADTRGMLRRAGDQAGEFLMEHVGTSRGLPTVWFSSGGTLCKVSLFALAAAAEPGAAAEAAVPVVSPRPKPRPRSKLTDELARRIERRSDTEFVVEREALELALSPKYQAAVTRSVGVRLHSEAGEVVGARLAYVRSDSIVRKLGLERGDILRAINGYALTGTERALEAYTQLRAAPRLSLELTRGGRPITIEVIVR